MMNQIHKCSRELKVETLHVFGSYAKGINTADSDVDILYSFSPSIEASEYFKHVFLLKEALESIIEKKIDLLSLTAIVNPYLKQEIENTKKLLYEA